MAAQAQRSAMIRVRVSRNPEKWEHVPEEVLRHSPMISEFIDCHRRWYNDRPDILMRPYPDQLIEPILQWLYHKHEVPDPDEHDEALWQAAFFGRISPNEGALMIAALQLQLYDLAKRAASYCAQQLRGQPYTAVQRRLGIQPDLTPEEAQAILDENAAVHLFD